MFYLGTTFVGEDFTSKETICSYTVGKSDEICFENKFVNFNFNYPTISDKIGLIYFITDMILILTGIRDFLLMVKMHP